MAGWKERREGRKCSTRKMMATAPILSGDDPIPKQAKGEGSPAELAPACDPWRAARIAKPQGLKTEAMHISHSKALLLPPASHREISHPDLSLEHIHEPPGVKQDRRVALVKRYQGMLAQAFRRCMSEMSRTIIAENSLGGSGTAERWEPRTERAYRKAQGAYGKESIGFVDHTELLEVETGRYSQDCVVCYANSNVFHIPVVLSMNEELRPGGSSRARIPYLHLGSSPARCESSLGVVLMVVWIGDRCCGLFGGSGPAGDMQEALAFLCDMLVFHPFTSLFVLCACFPLARFLPDWGAAVVSIGLAMPLVVILMGLVVGATSRRK
ncbi:hypothetical protein EDB83DRAFT_2319854 [Lactarius deliciosus]|nr:hypothetical protein EDB83DRAFT_2319854 [Lactarius deliciosus]